MDQKSSQFILGGTLQGINLGEVFGYSSLMLNILAVILGMLFADFGINLLIQTKFKR